MTDFEKDPDLMDPERMAEHQEEESVNPLKDESFDNADDTVHEEQKDEKNSAASENEYSESGRTETEFTDGYVPFREVKTEYEPPKKKKKKEVHMTKGAVAWLVVLCLAVSILAGAGMNVFWNDRIGPRLEGTTGDVNPPHNETTGDSSLVPGENTGNSETAPGIGMNGGTVEHSALSEIAEKCVQSVVVINVTETSTAYGQEYTTSGAGSGVIYTTNGYIITNYHVVGANTKTISVTLYNGETYEGRYIYGDEYADVAVIKIEKNDCVAAKIGDSTKMSIGDTVLAIGNPLGYGLTVTDGIVSALARDVTIENTTMTLMQTSAAINSGNSGGGLFNAAGELIGIVNAKVGGTSVEGMGFAIPSATVVKCINDLKNYGYITGKARLGVTVQTKQYQTWPYMQTYSYIQVTEINQNGSAAKSGLQVGDILQKINGTEITSFATLSQMLTKYEVGDTVTLTIRRPTIELTSNNLSEYLNSCKEIDITITFVEFNPNV